MTPVPPMATGCWQGTLMLSGIRPGTSQVGANATVAPLFIGACPPYRGSWRFSRGATMSTTKGYRALQVGAFYRVAKS